MSIRKNAIPKKYRAYYIEPGLCDYTAEGIGRVLVQKPALDRIAPTYIGKPVVNFEHTDKEPEELFNLTPEQIGEFADGVISDQGYDEKNGWYWMDFMAWDEETQANIENGYSVSCAYDVTEADTAGGSYHNMDYDEEVLDGVGLHLAIVSNPRYEDAYIIKNSKPGGKAVAIFKVKKKGPDKGALKNQETEKKDDEMDNAEEMDMENAVVSYNGKDIPMKDIMAAYDEKMEEMDNAGKAMNMEDKISYNGKEMTVGEMMQAAGMMEERDNAESPLDEDAEEVVDESLQNSKPNKESKKVNKKVQNAASGTEAFKPDITTSFDRFAEGKKRYGTAVKQEVK